MKIGEVARKYGISMDSLRYYIKEGLLVPEGSARYSRYEFRSRDLEDLEIILRMKEEQFPIKSILTLLTMRRTSNMIEPHTLDRVVALYAGHRRFLKDEINKYDKALKLLAEDESRLPARGFSARAQTGVPLRALKLLRCPVCEGTLRLDRGELDSQYIYSGTLYCGCGRSLPIKEGIIETGNLYIGKYDRPDLKRELITEIIGPFVKHLQKGMDEVDRFLERKSKGAGVIMETHLNGLFYAYNHLDNIADDALYIAVDRYPEMLREYKRLLESMGVTRDFLFIADNSMNLPIQKHSVDILVNCMSDNEYCLYNTGSYIGEMSPFLKADSEVVGIILSFNKNTRSQQLIHRNYPEGHEMPYSRKLYEAQYKNEGFDLTLRSKGVIRESEHKGRFVWSCHVRGDEMDISFIHAKRCR